MSREAMKLALEALEGNCTNPVADPEQAANEDAAIPALRQALATENQWVGLTDKDIDECYFAARQPDFDVWEFAAEIEEVLKKKNT